jgi:hypothetical protein
MADGTFCKKTAILKSDNTDSPLTRWGTKKITDIGHNKLRNQLIEIRTNFGRYDNRGFYVHELPYNNPSEVVISQRLNLFNHREFLELRVNSFERIAKNLVKETIENFQTQKLSVGITTMPSFVESTAATMQKKKTLVIERDNLIVIENMAIESVKDLNLDSKKWVCYNLETIGWDETLRLVEKARHLAHEKGILFLKQVVFIKETLSIEKQLKGLSIFGEAGATFRKYSKDKTFSEVINLFEEEIKKTRKLVEDHRKR